MRELDQLPQKIEQMESSVNALLAQISAPDFYSQDRAATAPVLQDFADSQQALDLTLERWSELEDLQQRYKASRS